MKVLAVDYGDKRTGLAVSDGLNIITVPLKTLKTESMSKVADKIALAAKEHNAGIIVLGLPLNMDGTEGIRASKTRSLGRVLHKITGLKIDFFDERLSSMEADELLKEAGVRRDRRGEVLDAVAAQLILEGYLRNNQNN